MGHKKMSGYIAELFCSAGAKELPKGCRKETGLVIKNSSEPVFVKGYKPLHTRHERKFFYDGSKIASIYWDTRIPIEQSILTFNFNLLYGDADIILETIKQVTSSIEDFIAEKGVGSEQD